MVVVDGCRVLSSSGQILSLGLATATYRLGSLIAYDAPQLAWSGGRAWVAGQPGPGSPVRMESLGPDGPFAITVPDAGGPSVLAADESGVALAAASDQGEERAWVVLIDPATSTVRTKGEFDGQPDSLATMGGTVAMTAHSQQGAAVLVGSPSSLRAHPIDPHDLVVGIDLDGNVVTVTLTQIDSTGVPSNGYVVLSQDRGATWRVQSLPPGEVTSVIHRADRWIEAGVPIGGSLIAKSTDLAHWEAVDLGFKGESPRLIRRGNTVWATSSRQTVLVLDDQ